MRDQMARAKKGGQRPDAAEDRFVESIVRVGAWLQHHTRGVVLGAVALVALVAGALYYRGYQQTVRERAASELQSLRAAASLEPASAIVQLQSFVNRFQGTREAEEARLMLAKGHVSLGQYEEAIAALEAVERPVDTPLGYGARSLLAVAHEEAGDVDAAMDVLENLGRNARYAFQRRAARAERARLLAEGGDLSGAAAIYEGLAAETDEPAEANEYRIRLGELRGRTASTAPRDPAEGGSEDAGSE